jgi:hypothetical protein
MKSTCKAVLVACAIALAGCAGVPETPAEPMPAPDPRAAVEKTEPPANCVRYTGTRIPVPEGKCVAYAGRVFTAGQIHNTGAMTVPEALRMLGAY